MLKRALAVISFALMLLTLPANAQTIAAAGDVLLDRGVAAQVQRHGYGYPFAHIRSTLRSADIAFANLECPITSRGIKVNKRFCFKADPRMTACLADGGLDVLSCANNHSMDCGRTGLVQTMAALKVKGVHWCGAGDTLADALTPTVVRVHGLRIAFVGFCDFIPEGVFLRDDRPTLAMASDENVRAAVTAARKQADIVVASFHWGVEFTDGVTDRQRHLAHVAAQSGADLVFGHHPHVTQGIEIVHTGKRTCLIDYSLGNFVFDTHLGYNKDPESTIILKVVVNRHGLRRASFLPVTIRQCAPSIAHGEEAVGMEARISRLSEQLGTKILGNTIELN